jgi:branched-chain amino acid transport system substrate-binding protein
LTGEWSSLGIASKAALEIATEDINRELAASGAPLRVRVPIEDTRLLPDVALEKVQALAAQGAKIVIGPQSSAEVRAIKPYVDANGVLVISQGSTSGALSLPADNVFRLAPDDSREAEAGVALLWEDGIRVLVGLGRNDLGNEGLQIATKRTFEALGGRVVDDIRYEPTAVDYSAQLAATSARLREAQAQYGADVVGIYLTAFEEVVSLFRSAQADPVLSSGRWYGTSSIANSASLIADPAAARFAASVGYPNPTVGLDESARPKWEPISDQIKAKTGSEPDAFGLSAYDALRIATQAVLQAGGVSNTAALRDALTQVANGYDGVTGSTALNEFGDRRIGSYDFWAVRFENGASDWKIVARFQASPSGGRVVRLADPTGPPMIVPEQSIRIGTPPEGSLFNATGNALGAAISSGSPIQARVEPFTGNTMYLHGMDAGEIELGVNGALDVWPPYGGADPRYPVVPDVRLLQRGAELKAGLLVRNDSAIWEARDLAGRRVASDFEPQVNVAALVDAILANAGLTWSDVQAVPVANTTDSLHALVEGWLDVAIGGVGAPEVADADAIIPGGIRFLGLDTSADAVDRMRLIWPFGVTWVDTGSDAAVREDVGLASYDIYLMASKKLSDNGAYSIVRAIWDAEPQLLAMGDSFAGWTRARAVDPTAEVPYHPGAVRFFRERGAWLE